MAEKEFKIKVTSESDISTLQDLVDVLNEAKESGKELDEVLSSQLNTNIDTSELDEITDRIEDVKSELETLTSKVEVDNAEIESLESELEELEAQRLELDVETDISEIEELDSKIEDIEASLSSLQASVEVDNAEIESLESELDELEQTQIELTIEADSSSLDDAKDSTDELTDSLNGVISSLDDLNSTLSGLDTSGLDNANNSAKELDKNLSDSTSGASELESAMGALGGAAAAAGLMETVDTAGRISDSWNRLGLTFGTVTDEMKEDINSAATTTGRSGGTIRDYFNQMGIAGVKNTDLLSQSFESLSGRAYQTNTSIETMENSMKRMVMTGNAGTRQLTQLGITTGDLARAMGVSAEEVKDAFESLSQEDRLRVLTQAMGDGKQANEEYKNSWQGVKDQASAAFAGLMGAVGTPILQMLIPIMQGATQVVKTFASVFKGLPTPLQKIIGAFGGVVLGATAIAGALGVAGKVVKGLYDGFKTLGKVVKFVRELEIATKAYSAAETIANGVRGAAAAAQAALNFVMSMNPIALVVIAIVALVGILWYLYNTCEPVRNAIDAIWAGVSGAIQPIIDSVQWLIDKLTQLVNGDWSVTLDIAKAGVDTAIDTGLDFANNDVSRGIVGMLLGDDALTQVDESMPAFQDKLTTSINDMLTAIWNDGTMGFLGWLGQIGGVDVGSYLSGMQQSFNNIPLWVNQAGTGAIQGFQTMFTGVSGWLNSTISNVASFGSRLITNLWTSAVNAVSGFMKQISSLPGKLAAELQRMLSTVNEWAATLPQKFWDAGVNAVKNFLNALGIHSPGFMAVNFGEEIQRLELAADNNSVAGNVGDMSRDIMSAWDNPNFKYSMDLESVNVDTNKSLDNSRLEDLLSRILDALNNRPVGQSSVTLNHYGDTDKEEKLNEILDFIVKAMAFSNDTAGRTN